MCYRRDGTAFSAFATALYQEYCLAFCTEDSACTLEDDVLSNVLSNSTGHCFSIFLAGRPMSLVCSRYQDMHWSSGHRLGNFLTLTTFETAVQSVVRAVHSVHRLLQFVVFLVHRSLEVGSNYAHTRWSIVFVRDRVNTV